MSMIYMRWLMLNSELFVIVVNKLGFVISMFWFVSMSDSFFKLSNVVSVMMNGVICVWVISQLFMSLMISLMYIGVVSVVFQLYGVVYVVIMVLSLMSELIDRLNLLRMIMKFCLIVISVMNVVVVMILSRFGVFRKCGNMWLVVRYMSMRIVIVLCVCMSWMNCVWCVWLVFCVVCGVIGVVDMLGF